MNARTLAAAWLFTVALTISGIFWLPQTLDEPSDLKLSKTGTTVCTALDTAWNCK
jgi:hypothetical protein